MTFDLWRAGSGYRTKSGNWKWRCWNESKPAGQKELLNKRGRPILFNTFEAADKRCKQLNRK